MKIKDIKGGTIFYDECGNSYIKLKSEVEIIVHHCCDKDTKSRANCLLMCEGIPMWIDDEKWVETENEFVQ